MSKFKQKDKRTVPNPPSGSLSDIVFMLLFFFMVTTTMRETESKVQVRLPEASEIATVMNDLSASDIASRSAAMKSRISVTVLNESFNWIRESVPN